MVLSRSLWRTLPWWLIFLSGLMPLAWLVWQALYGDLGTDPIAEVIHFTGEWALWLLWLTLAITPARIWLKWLWLTRYRRMCGLYVLFYASLHLLAFLALILEWQWPRFYEELLERPYISAGAIAWLLMLPLGLTSFKGAMKRMGRRWKQLHKLTYAVAVFAVIHIFWQVRSDYGEVLFYSVVLLILLSLRLTRRLPVVHR